MKNFKIAELLFNQPLMIAELKLNIILNVLKPRLNLDLPAIATIDMAEMPEQNHARENYIVQNGVATIGVYGPLMHRVLASEFPSGGPTSYAAIKTTFDAALADNSVKNIMFDFASPGGQVAGAFDLADYIKSVRGTKPIIAMVNESAFSAAYLLASACDKIIIPRTGGVGSIGVIATHADFSTAEKTAGITVTHVYAGLHKADGSPHQPLSDDAFKALQDEVNTTYDLFVKTVAGNLNIDEQLVRNTEAACFYGEKAISAGLAHEMNSYNDTVKNLAIMPYNTISKGVKKMELSELKELHPALYSEIYTMGKQDGMTIGSTAERTRISAILNIPRTVQNAHSDLINSGIENGLTAGDVALAITHRDAEKLAQAKTDIVEGANPPAPAATAELETQLKESEMADLMVNAATDYYKRN